MELVFKVLADPTRRKILDLLAKKERTSGEIAGKFSDISRVAVLQHLKKMKGAGLVTTRKEGRFTYNYINGMQLQKIYERWLSKHAGSAAKALYEFNQYAKNKGEKNMNTDNPKITRIRHEILVSSTQEDCYKAFTEDVGNWWPHRFKKDSEVKFEPKIGGRFYEDWKGGGALYGQITYLDYPNKFSIRGQMGLKKAALVVKWHEFEARGKQTLVKYSLDICGDIDDDNIKSYTEGAKAVLEEGFKPYVESQD